MDRQDGAAVAGSTLSARTRILIAVAAVVVLVSVTAVVALARWSTPVAMPSPTRSASSSAVAPAPSQAVAPPAAAEVSSDAIDGWAISQGGGSTRFLETEDHHGGGAALLISRPAGDGATAVPSIGQTVSVAQDSQVELAFWASSDGSSADGAVTVRMGGTDPASVLLPAGAFGWTRFTVVWTVPAKVTSAPLSIVVPGAAAGVRIDDVAVQGQGSRGVVVSNAGFETTSAPVSITDPSLVLQRSGGLHLASRLAPDGAFRWSAQEYTGGAPVTGRGRFTAGTAVVPLRDVPTGYYALTLEVPLADRTVTRSTDVVVTAAPPDRATSPLLGVGVHLGASDAQLAQKVADLKALGFSAARTDADWASIEQRPGQFDFSGLDPVVAELQRAGLRPLLIPDYRNPLYDGGRTPSSTAGVTAYARFAAAVAARYPDADIDVYNEFDWRFNDGACGTTPECYLQLLRPTWTAINATPSTGAVAGPDITGLGVRMPWLQAFIDGGGLGSIDALDFHPYEQPARPDVLDDQLTALDASLTAAGAPDKPVWFTEFGTSTARGWATERQQAEDVARVFGVAAAHGVDRVYWYDAIDDGPDPTNLEHRFGLFRAPTFLAPTVVVPKPAAAVVAALTRSVQGPVRSDSSLSGGASRLVTFASGTSLAWARSGTVPVNVSDRLEARSMTGRPIGRLRALGPSPVILRGGTVTAAR